MLMVMMQCILSFSIMFVNLLEADHSRSTTFLTTLMSRDYQKVLHFGLKKKLNNAISKKVIYDIRGPKT